MNDGDAAGGASIEIDLNVVGVVLKIDLLRERADAAVGERGVGALDLAELRHGVGAEVDAHETGVDRDLVAVVEVTHHQPAPRRDERGGRAVGVGDVVARVERPDLAGSELDVGAVDCIDADGAFIGVPHRSDRAPILGQRGERRHEQHQKHQTNERLHEREASSNVTQKCARSGVRARWDRPGETAVTGITESDPRSDRRRLHESISCGSDAASTSTACETAEL